MTFYDLYDLLWLNVYCQDHSTPHHSNLILNQFQVLTLSTPSLVYV